MNCPRCRAELPVVARYCHVCGQDVRTDDLTRRRSFAVRPDEPVASFALISTIMPKGAQRRQTYRVALAATVVSSVVAAIFGLLPIAILLAAFAVPIVYLVYLYDLNFMADEPLPAIGLTVGLTAGLTAVFTGLLVWLQRPELEPATVDGRQLTAAPQLGGFLVAVLLVPVVGELIRQVGPILLLRRPRFDDLMDGVTFGVAAGVAYACVDTLVRYWSLLVGGRVETDPGLWISLIFLQGFVKPLLLGTATGIACAEFAGLGRGYDGFTPRYFRAVAEAMLANAGFWGGCYLFSFVPDQAVALLLSIGWGLLILAILILRMRNVLHFGLMEAALVAASRPGTNSAGASVPDGRDPDFCGSCEMPLLDQAQFCTACGISIRILRESERIEVGLDPAGLDSGAPAPPASAQTLSSAESDGAGSQSAPEVRAGRGFSA